ncbi:hypothetical protein N6H18_06060 [Reichenbachiella agarivorans]|uniref:Uncharacterized protein n=1 Tax=Reichenbachiella agarivorans TaxID=2979464 RepID=A0ABY6CSL7_9BACT|nr:hypothetical protein [Reichenbachiella agarivorans]UXP33516.1 hypothetical protein N6H18_06060 [Reichenbachiella agarivorans]
MTQQLEHAEMLSMEEFGILCFTNSYYLDDELNNKIQVVLTSKPTYFWIPVLSHLIRSTDLTNEDIKVFIELSLNSLMSKNEVRWNNRALGIEGMLATLESVLFYTSRIKFNNPVLEHQSLVGSFIDEILERLENHGLIEDHNIEMLNGSPSVMMGLMPLGFTKRTRLGEEIYLKFVSKFRKMELQKEIKGSPSEYHYRLNDLWEIFKKSLFTMEETFGPTKKSKK